MAIDELVFEKELITNFGCEEYPKPSNVLAGEVARADFRLEDLRRPGAPPKFEDEELEARLDEDPTQTQKEP
ncbi:hypothetical protein LAZ67_16002580 [Cordylochernes scorpioides]|uniref:Uncharacterized protein n=1 Tax=Cordylochernes scorpioides TaxID=51811 RepID=A0ABY6LD01_9ARAC|nr:hypothetical protein LAZ67_16002580 [Cordylochernes scorpioides]